jgi:hypothetical protein
VSGATKRTLAQMAAVLRERNPQNKPMYLNWIAKQLWPDAEWLDTRTNRHNGGARVGARVAGAQCGRMEKQGLLRMTADSPRSYHWVAPVEEQGGSTP